MVKTTIKTLLASLLLCVAFAACSDDIEYTPGASVSDDTPIVYFDTINTEKVYVFPDVSSSDTGTSTDTVNIRVLRQNSTGKLTVPVIADSKSDGMEIPTSVTFEEGQDTTELALVYSKNGGSMKATFHLDDNYTNPYKAVGGSPNFSFEVAVLSKICRVQFNNETLPFYNEKSYIYMYEGKDNEFMWSNFCGSGINISFKVYPDDNTKKYTVDNIKKLAGDIEFTDHKYDYYGYGYYFLVDDNLYDVQWTPVGQDQTICYLYWYDYAYGSQYSQICFDPDNTSWTSYVCIGWAWYPSYSWAASNYWIIKLIYDE